VQPFQFQGAVYESLERLGVPIEDWAKVVNDYAEYAEGQDISSEDLKWFRKQLDRSEVALSQVAGKESEDSSSASGSDSEDDDAQSSGQDSFEEGVQAFDAASERLWKACDKNGDGAIATTEMLFCIRQGNRDEIIDQETEDMLLNSVRVGPQMAQVMLSESFEGSGIPQDEWLDTLKGVTDKCYADLQ
jgi:hypothetical protein